jgi:hypothetical protein
MSLDHSIDVFLFLGLLNAAATLILFLPYLRSFVRIRTLPLSGCALPDALKNAKKLKLRKCVVCWDREHRAIWLRPRGYSHFRVPAGIVAKLNTDERGTAIVDWEVRLSSGLTLAMAWFLWTLYQHLPASLPSDSGFVLAPFAALFVLALVVRSVADWSRFRKLVEDALSELTGNVSSPS